MRRPLIAIVDEGKQHVTLLRLALTQRGYAVAVVGSAASVRALAKRRAVGALVCAVEAPGDVLRDLGDERPAVAIAVVDPSRVEEIESLDPLTNGGGFDAVLPRPVDFAELDGILTARLLRRPSGVRAILPDVDTLPGLSSRAKR